MIESILIEYLQEQLDIPVYVMFPENPEDRFLVLDRTATEITNHVTRYEVAVQSYGETALAAATLNDEVISAMNGLIADDRLARIQLNNAYMFTDTVRKKNRYQAVFDFTML